MNLIVIGNNVDKIAMDIWQGNTNFLVLNKSPYIWDNEFKRYIKDKDVIVVTTNHQILDKIVNDVLDNFKENKLIPILIADDKNSPEMQMYSVFEEDIPETLLYLRNKNNQDYLEFIEMAQLRLNIKKEKPNNDNIIRTPKEGEKPIIN